MLHDSRQNLPDNQAGNSRRRFWGLGFLLPIVLVATLIWLRPRSGDSTLEPGSPDATRDDLPTRIISMAPSTTETLFALGLGDQVVGVTRYCDYPPEVNEIAKVGGYADPSYESIVALRPDLVILLTSHDEAKRELEKLKIPTIVTPHTTAADIHEAIRLIGTTCGAEARAHELLANLIQRRQAIAQAVETSRRPRVLLCIGRDTDAGQLAAIYVAGRHGFFDQIISMAGGINAYQNEQVPYPQLSAEGVVRLNPDIIVDLVSEIRPNGKTQQEIEQQWNPLRTVPAVRDGRVHVIVGPYALRPGPRYVELLEQLAGLLHVELAATGVPDE